MQFVFDGPVILDYFPRYIHRQSREKINLAGKKKTSITKK